LKAKLNLASALCDSIINLTKTLDEQKAHLEYTNDQVDTMLDFNTSIRATEMVLEIASTTTAAICTVISVVVPTPKAIWDAAIATAIAVTNGISIGCEITAMVNDYKTKKDERTFDTTLTNMKDTFDQLSAVCEQKKSILDDPNKTYSAKSKAAAEVITNVDDQLMNKLNGLLDASKASLDLDSSTINDYKNVVNTKTDMDKDEYTDQDLADMNLKANAYLVIAEAYVSTMAEYGDLILEQSYTWGMTSLFGGKMQGHEDDTARIVKE
jgi:gas vesicle protein